MEPETPLQHARGKGSEGEGMVNKEPAQADQAPSPGTAIHDESVDSVSVSSSTKWGEQYSHHRLAVKIHRGLSVG